MLAVGRDFQVFRRARAAKNLILSVDSAAFSGGSQVAESAERRTLRRKPRSIELVSISLRRNCPRFLAGRRRFQFRVKTTSIGAITSTGTPFSSVGRYTHWRTASSGRRQQGVSVQYLKISNGAVFGENSFQMYRAGDSRLPRQRGINRDDFLDELCRHDLAATRTEGRRLHVAAGGDLTLRRRRDIRANVRKSPNGK